MSRAVKTGSQFISSLFRHYAIYIGMGFFVGVLALLFLALLFRFVWEFFHGVGLGGAELNFDNFVTGAVVLCAVLLVQ